MVGLSNYCQGPKVTDKESKGQNGQCEVNLTLRGKAVFLAYRLQKLNCSLGDVQFISFSLSAVVKEKLLAVSAVSRSGKETKLI